MSGAISSAVYLSLSDYIGETEQLKRFKAISIARVVPGQRASSLSRINWTDGDACAD